MIVHASMTGEGKTHCCNGEDDQAQDRGHQHQKPKLQGNGDAHGGEGSPGKRSARHGQSRHLCKRGWRGSREREKMEDCIDVREEDITSNY